MPERLIRWLATFLLGTLFTVAGGPAAPALPGAGDGNGVVEDDDRDRMNQFLAGNLAVSEINAANADVNEDGRIQGLDGAWLNLAPPPFRGAVISCEGNGTVNRYEATFFLQLAGMGELLPVLYDVNLYKIRYQTIDPWGGLILASGVMGLPAGLSGSLPLLSMQHGTEVLKADAPSNPDYLLTPSSASVFAATKGYAMVGADYLGLGDGPGFHPYLHAATEATACLDMIRAGRRAAPTYNATLDSELFLAGYSQGGHATLALHWLIENRHPAEFSVTACAPMAGPYDLSGTTMPYVLSIETPGSPHVTYLPYTMLSLDYVYDVWSNAAEVFVSPYDVTVYQLYDGLHTAVEIEAVLPPIPNQVLTPAFLAAILADPDHPLNVAIRANDVYDWAPLAPVRLYHGGADTTVPFANAEVAYNRMHALGANVELVNVGPTLNHTTALVPCTLAARHWFDTFLAAR